MLNLNYNHTIIINIMNIIIINNPISLLYTFWCRYSVFANTGISEYFIRPLEHLYKMLLPRLLRVGINPQQNEGRHKYVRQTMVWRLIHTMWIIQLQNSFSGENRIALSSPYFIRYNIFLAIDRNITKKIYHFLKFAKIKSYSK